MYADSFLPHLTGYRLRLIITSRKGLRPPYASRQTRRSNCK